MIIRVLIIFSGVAIGLLSIPALADWSTNVTKDEMTGETTAYASSPSVTATKSMSFPYTGTKAWLGIGCNTQSEWAYIGFSEAPNLNNTETRDGYNLIKTRTKWNEKIETATLTQDWGGRFLHFRYDDWAISNIVQNRKVLVELNWHGQGKKYFRFSLGGSGAALSKIRSSCNT